MPFKDLPEGTTHYYEDNCGMPEHNKNMTEKKECCGQCVNWADHSNTKKWEEKGNYQCLCLGDDIAVDWKRIKIFIRQLIQQEREHILGLLPDEKEHSNRCKYNIDYVSSGCVCEARGFNQAIQEMREKI